MFVYGQTSGLRSIIKTSLLKHVCLRENYNF